MRLVVTKLNDSYPDPKVAWSDARVLDAQGDAPANPADG